MMGPHAVRAWAGFTFHFDFTMLGSDGWGSCAGNLYARNIVRGLLLRDSLGWQGEYATGACFGLEEDEGY